MRVEGSVCRVKGLGLGGCGLRFWVEVRCTLLASGCLLRLLGLGFRIWGLRLRVYDLRTSKNNSKVRVEGLRFKFRSLADRISSFQLSGKGIRRALIEGALLR